MYDTNLYGMFSTHLKEHFPDMKWTDMGVKVKGGFIVRLENIFNEIPHLMLLESDFDCLEVAKEVNRRMDGVGDKKINSIGAAIYIGGPNKAQYRYFIDILRQESYTCIFCGGEFDVLPTKEVYVAHFASCVNAR